MQTGSASIAFMLRASNCAAFALEQAAVADREFNAVYKEPWQPLVDVTKTPFYHKAHKSMNGKSHKDPSGIFFSTRINKYNPELFRWAGVFLPKPSESFLNSTYGNMYRKVFKRNVRTLAAG